jgi:hypothetical protein
MHVNEVTKDPATIAGPVAVHGGVVGGADDIMPYGNQPTPAMPVCPVH